MLLLLSACGGGSNDDPIDPHYGGEPVVDKVLSLSASVVSAPPPANDADLLQRYLDANQLARDAGARGQFLSWRWSELESTLGNYDTAVLDNFNGAMNFAAQQGLVQLLGLQVINTVTREVPAELVDAEWDSAAMINAFTGLLDQLLPAMQGRITYLSIGNEVDVYFENGHLDELAAYRNFVDTIQNYLRSRLPQAQIGITVTAGGWLGSQVQYWLDLTAHTDVIITTYYPLKQDFAVRVPAVAAADIPNLLAQVTDKPWVFQEVGYPSSVTGGSSEATQTEFVRRVFAAWRDSGDRIPFLNWFLLHDLPQDLVDQLVIYYGQDSGVNSANFRAYLDSLGLRQRDGTPKNAWPAFVEEGQAYR